jgi:putative ABC transport system permease protein
VTADDVRPLVEAALTELAALPGVRNVAIAIRAPLSLSGGGLAQRVYVAGTPDPPGGLPEVKFNAVTAEYFPTLGLRLLEGRTLSSSDERDGPRAIVVSARFRQTFFPDGRAIGRLVRLGGPNGLDHEVVGVVADAVINAVGEEPEPYFYVPFWRDRREELTIIVDAGNKTAALTRPVRDLLRRLDPRLDPRTIVLMGDLISYAETRYRSTALLAGGIAIVGLLLTAIGVYGLVSLNAASRTREMGIRIALGAARRDVLGLMLGNGARVALAGMTVGIPGALFVTRLLSSLLFDLSPWDVGAFGAAVAIVLACVAMATFIAARRLTRLSPSTVLRVG